MENRILSIGSKFPEFKKTALVALEMGKEFKTITSECNIKAGQWRVLFWWPMDFTFICPTEIAEFNKNFEEFEKRNTELLGASTDSEFVHLAWRKNHPDLKNLKFPMIADTSKSLAESLGILEGENKVAYRTTYIIDPEGIIRWVCQNDLNVGRNVHEVLRVLDALQSGGMTPCNWEKGDKLLDPSKA